MCRKEKIRKKFTVNFKFTLSSAGMMKKQQKESLGNIGWKEKTLYESANGL